MQKWEYHVATAVRGLGTVIMNQFGAEGWELVAIIEHPTDKTIGVLYYFKRPIS